MQAGCGGCFGDFATGPMTGGRTFHSLEADALESFPMWLIVTSCVLIAAVVVGQTTAPVVHRVPERGRWALAGQAVVRFDGHFGQFRADQVVIPWADPSRRGR